MYFLVNASPPKPLDVATSNFTDALVRLKAVFEMVYHRLKSSFAVLTVQLELTSILSIVGTMLYHQSHLAADLIVGRLGTESGPEQSPVNHYPLG